MCWVSQFAVRRIRTERYSQEIVEEKDNSRRQSVGARVV